LGFRCWPLSIPLEGVTKLNGTKVVKFQRSVAVRIDLSSGYFGQYHRPSADFRLWLQKAAYRRRGTAGAFFEAILIARWIVRATYQRPCTSARQTRSSRRWASWS
jgi:hypothetical protein